MRVRESSRFERIAWFRGQWVSPTPWCLSLAFVMKPSAEITIGTFETPSTPQGARITCSAGTTVEISSISLVFRQCGDSDGDGALESCEHAKEMASREDPDQSNTPKPSKNSCWSINNTLFSWPLLSYAMHYSDVIGYCNPFLFLHNALESGVHARIDAILFEPVVALCGRTLPQVTYVVNHPEESWTGEKGFISKDIIARHLFPPGEGVKIVVCGPWKMCQAMKGLLKEVGYTDRVRYCFEKANTTVVILARARCQGSVRVCIRTS